MLAATAAGTLLSVMSLVSLVSVVSVSLGLLVTSGPVSGYVFGDALDRGSIATENVKSSLTSLDLHLNYNNETTRTGKDGHIKVLDRTIEETNNRTGETHVSHIHMEMPAQWNSVDHECMVDEDCGDLKYCLYEIENSKCLPCIPTDMPCTKDEECCSDELCVWGQCTVNVTRGAEGTICQSQSDCRSTLCCAFQRELLFPVCNPRPERGESCLSHPNLLMDMLAWDPESPQDHCPCAPGLQCQPHGRGSLCGE
ncbi:dickkopf-related protein 3b isoform X2 [Lampris incognitus]|uniref:dickkopf-related protein 3b isoform X2 n=1 Tax=Lampris incognitus TaxID=2546036 RepID=UPI0024B57892|nr:dickkopf-related protein 3b isoform X2 [Lampris incognitus]